MKRFKQYYPLFFIFLLLGNSCKGQERETEKVEIGVEEVAVKPILVGAETLDSNEIALLKDQSIALVVNQTSMVGEEHLVDVLLAQGISIINIFAPEHGFRGKADAGENISNGVDSKTNIPLISLHGKHKKPRKEDLAGIDLVIFDIQDVGARFYTYISTLHYVMEACAENDVKVLVLDRPNPNGDVVDGMVLNPEFQSFIGMHPIPVLHGMTIAEYALMINGEGWLKDGVSCNLLVNACRNYDHTRPYSLPIKPSPNLPDDRSIEVYASTCFFEGTVLSEGRGTDHPFQIFGSPDIPKDLVPFTFMPKSKEGAKYPKFENKTCYGFDISESPNDFEEQKGINLDYIITMYNLYPYKEDFFLKNGFFDLLAGGTELRNDIVAGKSAEEIKASWQEDLDAFKEIRKKYLLYSDFE